MWKTRREASKALVEIIEEEVSRPRIVFGIPRGGVILAAAVAEKLSSSFSLVVVKKLSAPGREELTIGAVGKEKDSLFLNEDLIKELKIKKDYLDRELNLKRAEVARREKEYQPRNQKLTVAGKKAIIIDDGVATGATMIAAIRQLRLSNPDEVIVAVPVISISALEKVQQEADRVIKLTTPKLFFSVSQFFEQFPQVSDEEVKRVLAKAR